MLHSRSHILQTICLLACASSTISAESSSTSATLNPVLAGAAPKNYTAPLPSPTSNPNTLLASTTPTPSNYQTAEPQIDLLPNVASSTATATTTLASAIASSSSNVASSTSEIAAPAKESNPPSSPCGCQSHSNNTDSTTPTLPSADNTGSSLSKSSSSSSSGTLYRIFTYILQLYHVCRWRI